MQPNVQFFNLIQFDETFLQRILSRNRSLSKIETLLARGELIEAYFWLALGSEIEFFPAEAAKRLVHHRLVELFDLLGEHLNSYGSLFPQDFATRITMMPHKIFDQMLAPEAGQSFQSPHSLQGAFQAALVGETEFMEDDSATLCVSTLLFSDEDDFEGVILLEDEIQRPDSRIAYRENLWRGALQSLAHMALFRDWERSLKTNKSIGFEDAALLANRIRQLTRWKLNFLVNKVDSRFRTLMQTLSTNANLIPPDSVQGFTDTVEDLVNSWARDSGTVRRVPRGRAAAADGHERRNGKKVPLSGSERQPIGTRVGDQPTDEIIEVSVILKPKVRATAPFGSKSGSNGNRSLRSLANSRWHQMPSTEMPISSA